MHILHNCLRDMHFLHNFKFIGQAIDLFFSPSQSKHSSTYDQVCIVLATTRESVGQARLLSECKLAVNLLNNVIFFCMQ